METRHFQKLVLSMKMFLSLWSFPCHIVNIRVWKYVFTRVVIKIKIFHSCLTFVVCVALVLHLCCARVARLTLVLYIRLDQSNWSAAWFHNISIALKLVYNRNKLFKTLHYWSRNMLNLEFLDKGLEMVSPLYFVYDFSRKMFLML